MRANALAAIVLGLFLLSGGCAPAKAPPKYRVELLDEKGDVKRTWYTKTYWRPEGGAVVFTDTETDEEINLRANWMVTEIREGGR